MTERLRNHPTYMLRMLVAGLVLGGLMLFTLPDLMGMAKYLLAASVLGVFVILGVGIWYCSWLTMYEDHAVSESNFIIRKKTVIPYAKVASANVVRSLLDYLFGTSNIRVNVNSAVNSANAEVSFILKKDVAERVRITLTTGMFGEEVSAENTDSATESVADCDDGDGKVRFTYLDSFAYGLLGTGTAATLWSAILIVYSVYGFVNGGGGLYPLLLLVFTTGINIVSSIIRYCNFELVRNGDRIHIHHGLTRTYDTEFEVRRINACRIRRPLLMRVIGRCTVEVEVVGINAMKDTVTPVVGLMVRERDLDAFLQRFVPEFDIDIPSSSVPTEAKVPMACRALFFAVPVFAILFAIHFGLTTVVPMDDADANVIAWLIWIAGTLSVFLPILIGLIAIRNYRICRFGTCGGLFRVVRGAIDRETVTMQFDRVQVFSTVASPSARRHGVAKAKLEFLSSAGAKSLETGFFHSEDLEFIQETMLARLANGEYDYRSTEI